MGFRKTSTFVALFSGILIVSPGLLALPENPILHSNHDSG